MDSFFWTIYKEYNLLIKIPFKISTWKMFILVAGIAAAIGYIISFILLFSNVEKQKLLDLLLNKFKKGRQKNET